jgi:hypothetical protein
MTTTVKPYLFSVPERMLRSATALAAGLVREIGEVALPAAVHRSRLYQNLVGVTLQFIIEQVGQVKGAYPASDKLSRDFLLRRTAGNGIELIGVLAFRTSPVWVLAALADASGVGRYLIQEISGSLKEEGLLDPKMQFTTVDQMLDGLGRSAGHLAETLNCPPLDIPGLRHDWHLLRNELKRIPTSSLPTPQTLRQTWSEIKSAAAAQNRTVFEMSSVLALSAMNNLPQKSRVLSRSAAHAVRKTGQVVAAALIEDYRQTLAKIRETGYMRYAVRQFRPYLFAAALQFSPRRKSLTERIFRRRKGHETAQS